MIDKIRFKIINFLLNSSEKDLIVTSMFNYYYAFNNDSELHARVCTFTRKIDY